MGTMIPLPPSIPSLEFWEQLQKDPKMQLWLLITQPQMCKGKIFVPF